MAKRAKVRVTKVPSGVRDLWEQTAPEVREQARRRAMVLLEYWSGRKTKAESAAELHLPPVRIWQLTQAGLSGMVVGLVKQPRRKRGPPMKSAEEKEISRLRKVNEAQERRLRILEQLIAVLRGLPNAEGAGGKKTGSGESKPRRSDPAERGTATRGPRVARREAGRERADAVDVGARGGAKSGPAAARGGRGSGDASGGGGAAGGAGKDGRSGCVAAAGEGASAAAGARSGEGMEGGEAA